MKKRQTETSIAIRIWLGLIIVFIIYKYIDTLIIKLPLMIFTGGAFFYSILDRFKEALRNDIEEASITGKIPTLKDGIRNWSKAIFFVILFLISLLLSFPDLADKYIFCRGADEGKQPVSSGCYDMGVREHQKWEDIPCLKGLKYGDPMEPNPDYVGPEVKCENQKP